MSAVKKAENQLEQIFKGLPQLPEASKESLVKAWPWIALIFGVLQLIVALALWNFVRNFDSSYLNSVSLYLTGREALSGFDKMVIYFGLLILVVDGIILLMAYPALKTRSRRGWDLLFLGSLLNVAYAVVALFMRDHGMGTFLSSLVGSAVGFYLLFQVRSKYTRTT
jgi:predicted neutral ceramidase superfamily lipid hydrolase